MSRSLNIAINIYLCWKQMKLNVSVLLCEMLITLPVHMNCKNETFAMSCIYDLSGFFFSSRYVF